MGSPLTVSPNNAGLFILYDNKIYKGFPPKWSGYCGLGDLLPKMTRYDSLNASEILNLGSFVHEVIPHKRALCGLPNPSIQRGFQISFYCKSPSF